MTSLFGHLVARFSSGPENVATEALAYILGRSAAARRAMNQLPASLGMQLPEIRAFKTQAFGDDLSIPDLAGLDATGSTVMLVENKFWAGLTMNQPAAYLARLPVVGAGLLLFVVPQRRLHTIWPDLVVSAARAGIDVPLPVSYDGDLIWGRVEHRILAITSWPSLLNRIEAEVRSSGDTQILSDVSQLRGLCEHMDSTGFIPASFEELTNTEIPRWLLATANLVPEMCDRAIAAKIADGKGLRPSHFWHGAGRYLRIGAAGGWVGIDHKLWARLGIGPLWMTFHANEYGCAGAVLKALAPWLSSNPAKAFDLDGSAAVPLRITAGATRDIVLADLHAQLVELHRVLRSLGTDQNSLPPDAGDAAP